MVILASSIGFTPCGTDHVWNGTPPDSKNCDSSWIFSGPLTASYEGSNSDIQSVPSCVFKSTPKLNLASLSRISYFVPSSLNCHTHERCFWSDGIEDVSGLVNRLLLLVDWDFCTLLSNKKLGFKNKPKLDKEVAFKKSRLFNRVI